MRAVIQRVFGASCVVDGEVSGKCAEGLLVLLGVKKGDTEEDAKLLCEKIAKLRIFNDENDKMNLSVMDVDGEMLVISNFTLLADYSHGNRPSYFEAEVPERADELYMYFVELMREKIKQVGTGVFGAEMHIETKLMGPITITMDSEVLKKKGK